MASSGNNSFYKVNSFWSVEDPAEQRVSVQSDGSTITYVSSSGATDASGVPVRADHKACAFDDNSKFRYGFILNDGRTWFFFVPRGKEESFEEESVGLLERYASEDARGVWVEIQRDGPDGKEQLPSTQVLEPIELLKELIAYAKVQNILVQHPH